MSPRKFIPVILSGGSGTRLWPLSTTDRPKQFLPLLGHQSLIQQTVERCAHPMFGRPILVSSSSHEHLVLEAMGAAAPADYLAILEPAARNTAPAIALAALAVEPDEVLLVMPSDHHVADVSAFHSAAAGAATLAADGHLATFGIVPTHPATGYGYVKKGEPLGEGFAVTAFVEKPDMNRAAELFGSGEYYWNGGIFAFRAGIYLEALGRFQPEMLRAARDAMEGADRVGNFIRPNQAAFASSPSDSIDYAVLERADTIAMVVADMGWSDVGNWNALHNVMAKDDYGNSVVGDGLLIDCGGTALWAGEMRVSILGVQDLAVIVSGNDLVILPRDRAEEVRTLHKQRATDASP